MSTVRTVTAVSTATAPDDPLFTGRVVAALDEVVELVVRRSGEAGLGHRVLAHRAKALVAAHVTPRSRHRGDPAMIQGARALTRALARAQAPSGLFTGGDNVESPPDSAFTVNDVADTRLLLGGATSGQAGALGADLDTLIERATPPLLTGGVHTPNHRWELSAALARLHRLQPQGPGAQRLLDRVDQWLAEGVDLDEDGLYSERSANYAALVSNPSLLTTAAALGRHELADAVERNLEATLDLLLPDGSVETVLSRRHDQRFRFGLRAYLLPYRQLALDRGRGDFAWAAGRALHQGVHAPATAATDVLLDPRLALALPDPVPPPPTRRRRFVDARTALVHDGRRAAVVFGGSDRARHGRVASGLANSPTFLRLFAGRAVLDSVRLSRTFFGFGPFRSDGLVDDDGTLRLSETVGAAYYQPLVAPALDPDGRYDVVDEGRFAAAMSFGARRRDVVSLTTAVGVAIEPGRVGLVVELRGPRLDWALELAFRPGGVLAGARDLGGGRWVMDAGSASYRVGGDAIEVEVEGGVEGWGSAPARYEPGEEYAFLGGTDAAGGERLYLTGTAPTRLALSLRSTTSPESGW